MPDYDNIDAVIDAKVSVHELVARLRSQVRGVAKHGQAPQQQGGYSYQSIEDILAVVSPIMANYGLTVQGDTRAHEYETWQTRDGKRVESHTVEVRYHWVGPLGDHRRIGTYRGNAWDYNGDKGLNKAYTAARKLMWRDAFQLSTTDDVDTEAVDMPDDAGTQAEPPPPGRDDGIDIQRIRDLRAAVTALDGEAKEAWDLFSKNFGFGQGVVDQTLTEALMVAAELWVEHLAGGFPVISAVALKALAGDPWYQVLEATIGHIHAQEAAEGGSQEPESVDACGHEAKDGRACVRHKFHDGRHSYGEAPRTGSYTHEQVMSAPEDIGPETHPAPEAAIPSAPGPQATDEEARSAAQRLQAML